MRHFFTRFDNFCVLCVNPTQPLGQFDNQTLSNLIERLSSTKFGNRTQSNLVAGGHVAPKIWEPKIREKRRVNNCRYDKIYSVGGREEFAASFIIS